jgi:Fur family ferric uptake transcriptional regulator
MIFLNNSDEGKAYFVLEVDIKGDEKYYLESIGIFSGSLITVNKNIINSQNPIIVEVNECQFMIGRDLSYKINISPVLENQEIIFKGNKTKQREVILNAIGEFDTHFSLKDCVNLVQKKDSKIGEITVYRTLKKLIEKNIIEEIELPDGSKKMELLKGHHDHIFCKNCGNIIEFFSPEIENLQKHIAEEKKITLFSHKLILLASDCEKCRF